MKQNRALWADILRILSMFFVVFIHVSPLPSAFTFYTLIDYINFAIVKSCIALFFMISGALLLGKEEAYTTFFQKRFFKVIFPWIFWTVIYTVIQGMIDCKTVRTIPQWKHLFELTLFTRFWILPVLVGLYLVTPLLRIFFKHAAMKDNYYVLLISFIFLSLLPTLHDGSTFPIGFPAGIFSQIMMCGAFFVEGYILTTLPKKKFSFLQCISLVGVGVLLTILLSIYHVQEVDRFAYSMFSPGLVFIATGLFMTIRLVDPFFEKYSERTKHSIRAISVASFGVYLIHEAVHMSFRYLLLTSHMTYLLRSDLFIEYIRTIIIYSLSTAIILLIQRIPYVKRIVP